MFDDLTAQLGVIARSRVERAGISWSELESQATHIVIFGSFALSGATASSDLDILCVGKGKRIRSPELHLIWISPQRTTSREWLTSELATHVATYGKWIKGENTWALFKTPSEHALSRKKQRIYQRTLALFRHWNDLGSHYQYRHLLNLRRDLQRYALMKAGQAPIPKTFLDAFWTQCAKTERWEPLLNEVPDLIPQLQFILAQSKDFEPVHRSKSWNTQASEKNRATSQEP